MKRLARTSQCFHLSQFRGQPPWERLGRPSCSNRSGSILVLSAVMLVILLGCAAFAVDVAYIQLTRAELRSAADSASLAAIGTLARTGSVEKARTEAARFARLNKAAGQPVLLDPFSDVLFGREVYDSTNKRYVFQASVQPYDSVKVVARRTAAGSSMGKSPGGSVNLLFGRTLGVNSFQSFGQAVARYQPRDIALVIDLSGSMLYDSSLYHERKVKINIRDVWGALGSPKFGTMQDFDKLEKITGSNAYVIKRLGLNNVAYPYPGGSWDEYVNFVKYQPHLRQLGYNDRYGLKTWMDYVLLVRRSKADTPDLYRTPEQPITAVKQAVGIMMRYLKTLDTEERASFVTYDTSSRIEQEMSSDLYQVSSLMNAKQAGHYGNETNIGEGIRRGWESLTSKSARDNAHKIMIVFTDGHANRPGRDAHGFALKMAKQAAKEDITIHTITFGYLADQQLMAEIADIGAGIHYHVPGYDVDQYTAGLMKVLLDIASQRPLSLAQ